MMKKCIVVLGMHRSGTSALMGVLKTLSIEMGSVGSGFVGPFSDNIKGFFELVDIVNLDERILGSLGSSWDSLHVLPENWWKKNELYGYKKEISDVIERNFHETSIIGIKDPRLCRLLPLWAEMFKELGIETYYIIPLRNPLEVALSLETRNGFCREKSLLLWMLYMLEAELYSRKYRRVFISYDGLLNETENTIKSLSKVLKIDFPKTYQDARMEISEFLDAGLKHHNQETFPDDKVLPKEIFSLYSLLLRFRERDEISEDELSEIDVARNWFFSLHRFFYNKDVSYNMSAISNFESVLAEKNMAIAKKELTIAKYESRIIYIPLLKKLEQNIRKKIKK